MHLRTGAAGVHDEGGRGFAASIQKYQASRDFSNCHQWRVELTYGAVVTLVLMVATIEVDWRNGKLVKIKKHALSDATIRALLEVLARIKPPGQN